MDQLQVAAGATFAVIAALHSVLGEVKVVRPLLADGSWRVAGLPRPSIGRLLRGAWHLTTLAWLALAATTLGVSGPSALVATALLSGVIIAAILPSHLAWPLFLLAALLGAVGTELIGPPMLTAFAIVATVVAGGAAVIHLLWALGLAQTWARAALPTTRDGAAALRAGPAATLGVCAALVVFTGALVLLVTQPSTASRILVAGAIGVLGLRAIGDGRYVGFTKRLRSTAFARLDDVIYTPIVVLLALGGTSGLLR